MNRRSAVTRLAAAGAGFVFTARAPSAPQVLPDFAPPPQESTFRSESALVLLDVSVKDDDGRFVPGLRKENFFVLEDGKPQHLRVFDAEDRPVTVGIVVDDSRSMIPKKADVLTAARTFIEESNRLDEVFVLHFNEKISRGLPSDVPFSSDPVQLMAALSRGFPGGKTALYDGLSEGLMHLNRGSRSKKTLVLISDGGDTASHRSRKETIDMVERSAATIYGIGLFDAEDPDHDTGFLRRIAKVSGGETYLPANSSDMVRACRRLAKEIRTRYTIGYVPQASRDAGHFRNIQVRARDLEHGKLNVRTRSGYKYE
jgi:Ca-activated chloride channel homolog